MDIVSKKYQLRVEDVVYPEDQRPIPENPVDAVYKQLVKDHNTGHKHGKAAQRP